MICDYIGVQFCKVPRARKANSIDIESARFSMMFAFLVYFLAVLYVSPCTALDKYYSLWPVASDHSDDNDKITEDLTNRIGSDNFMMSKSPTLGVMYWFAKFSDEDVKHYQGVPGVHIHYYSRHFNSYYTNILQVLYVADLAEVNKPDEDAIRANFKRRASLTRRSMTSQVPASKHLRTISTAPGQDWEKQDGYHFDDTAGQGTRLYIIDSGLDLTHKVGRPFALFRLLACTTGAY